MLKVQFENKIKPQIKTQFTLFEREEKKKEKRI